MNEWISVNDRMPAEGVDVLVLIEPRYYPVCHCREKSHRWVFTAWIFENEWETIYGQGRYSLSEVMEVEFGASYGVTHWMPIPEPPKENENRMRG